MATRSFTDSRNVPTHVNPMVRGCYDECTSLRRDAYFDYQQSDISGAVRVVESSIQRAAMHPNEGPRRLQRHRAGAMRNAHPRMAMDSRPAPSAMSTI